MRFTLSMTLLSFAGAAASVGACGPNVILDGMTTGTGSGGSRSTTGTAFGGSASSFGAGGSPVTNGAASGDSFSSTTSFGPGAGGSIAETSTVAVGAGGSSVVGAGGAGGGGVVINACADGPDEAILGADVIYMSLVECALLNPSDAGWETMCFMSLGLSPECLNCTDDDVACTLDACLDVCKSDPYGASCMTCRNQSCGSAFLSCSGLPYAPGSESCASVLSAAEMGSGWQFAVPEWAFVTTNSLAAYVALGECACGHASTSCSSSCSGGFDLCDSGVASPQCMMCLESGACSFQLMACENN